MPQDVEFRDLGETRDLVAQQMRRNGRVHRDFRHLSLRQGITYPSRNRLLEDEVLTIHQSLNPLDRIFLPILHGYPSALCFSSLLPLPLGEGTLRSCLVDTHSPDEGKSGEAQT